MRRVREVIWIENIGELEKDSLRAEARGGLGGGVNECRAKDAIATRRAGETTAREV